MAFRDYVNAFSQAYKERSHPDVTVTLNVMRISIWAWISFLLGHAVFAVISRLMPEFTVNSYVAFVCWSFCVSSVFWSGIAFSYLNALKRKKEGNKGRLIRPWNEMIAEQWKREQKVKRALIHSVVFEPKK